jgi:hypothetical protein
MVALSQGDDLLLSEMEPYKDMVRTRSGNEVFHTEASYGRAARSESTRQQLKRKVENIESASMMKPRRTRSHTRSQMELDVTLETPPSALCRVGTTSSPKTERMLRTSRKPRCSDFGVSRHFAFQGQGFFFLPMRFMGCSAA